MSDISVFLIAGLAMIVGTLYSLRREHIRVEYSVSWLAVGCILTGLSLFPSILRNIAQRLGLDPQLFFLFVAGALLSAILFEVSRVVSRILDENVMLTQRVAILEFQLRQLAPSDGDQD